MATKRQIEEQDRASEARRHEAVGTIIANADSGGGQFGEETLRDIATRVLNALVDAIRAESVDLAELRRKGWQTSVKAHVTAAEIVEQWRLRLVSYTPPAGMPTREPADIPRNHGAQTPAELEQRLVDAFGPELAPVRHIRTVIERATDPERHVTGEDGVVYGPLCNATTGSFTHPGGANCEECHRIYAEQQGQPYTGPTSGMDVVRTIETIIDPRMPDDTIAVVPPPSADGSFPGDAAPEVIEHFATVASERRDEPVNVGHYCGHCQQTLTKPCEVHVRRDEPVTPTVARAIREEIESERETIAVFQLPEIVQSEIERSGAAQDVAERLAALPDATVTHHPAAPALGVPARTVTEITPAAPLNIVEPTAPAVRPRMTAAQVREHGIARARGADHRSVSQIEGISDCGTRYALSDLERPAWWNVGGKALHRAVETINRTVADAGPVPDMSANPDAAQALFLAAFDAEIADQHAATPDHPMSTWRAGDRGRENYDWWRVEGPVMVQRWVAWLSRMLADGWTIATANRVINYPATELRSIEPVIEYETRLDVGIGVPNLSIIDLALFHRQRNTLLVVDAKAGKSAPKDTFQLGVYGWSLLAAGVAGFTPAPDLANVRGAYWRARTGEAVPSPGLTVAVPTDAVGWPILQMHPWPDVVQRYRDADALDRNGIYPPNVSTFCGGCGVADLCPAKATT